MDRHVCIDDYILEAKVPRKEVSQGRKERIFDELPTPFKYRPTL